MSRASDYAKAIQEGPPPFDVIGERFAYVNADGRLRITRSYLQPEDVPDFIAWLHDTFIAETPP